MEFIDSFRKYCLTSIVFNCILLITSIIYYTGFRSSIFGIIVGFLFIITFFINIGVLILSDHGLKKNRLGQLGKITHYLSYLYLLFIALGFWFFISREGEYSTYFFSIIIVQIFISFSIILIFLNYKLLKIEISQESIQNTGRGIKIIKIFVAIFCILFFLISFLIAWAILTGGPPLIGILTGAIGSWTAGIFILILPAITILFSKIFSKKKHPHIKTGIIIIGITLTGIFTLPLFAHSYAVYDANMQFEEHFGENWNTFDDDIKKQFMDTPFVLGNYYFGFPILKTDNYKFEKDIIFVDTNDYTLKYDVYYPVKKNLVGSGKTIIYLHGGAWTMGDKGGYPERLEYFAVQGYTIFDIQYRLLDMDFVEEVSGLNLEIYPTEKDVLGDWTIYDLIEDVASFTRYLHSNNEYNADLDDVYFMGRSAGAYLAAIATFGYNEGYWNFSQWLNISGGIFLSPPNFAEYFFYEEYDFYGHGFIPGDFTPDEDPELYDRLTPSMLADSNDPPCLMFHGTSDQLVPYENSLAIYHEMKEANNIGILVKGFFGAHGHTQGVNYYTTSLYYTERFLYLT